MTSLQDRAISGMFWSFLQKFGSRGITFLVMVILARLLTPRDFGLIGMLTIFIQVSQVLVIGGFNMALIQKKDPDEEDYSSVFYINLAVSISLYLILFFTAPFIADFYSQSILTPLTRVLALIFIINAFSYVQQAKLTKEMRFKTLMLIHIPSTFISGLVSIIMALLGFGVWSIVALQLIMQLAFAMQIWIYAKWKPLLHFSKFKASKLFSFGGKLMVGSIIDTIYKNLYLVILGKFFPLSSVGYYQNANNLVQYPASTITSVMDGVMFSAFSFIQDDNERLKSGYRKAIQQVFFLVCPAFILAGVLAEPLFRFIFTAKWLPAVPYFQILCIVGIIYPLSAFNLGLVNVKGRSDVSLKLQIINKIIITGGILISIPLGIWALLVSQAVCSLFALFINSYYSGKFINYSLLQQIIDVFPISIISIIIGGIVFLEDHILLHFPDYIRLLTGFVIGILLYYFSSRLFKLTPYLQIVQLIRKKVIYRFQ